MGWWVQTLPQAAQPDVQTSLSRARPRHQPGGGGGLAPEPTQNHLGCSGPSMLPSISPLSAYFLRPWGRSPKEKALLQRKEAPRPPRTLVKDSPRLRAHPLAPVLGLRARPGAGSVDAPQGRGPRARHSQLAGRGGAAFSGAQLPRRRRGSRGSRGRRT